MHTVEDILTGDDQVVGPFRRRGRNGE